MRKLFKSPIFALWLTVFIDLVGLGIVIPIFAALFFVPGASFFHYEANVLGFEINTALMYGLLVASYPLAQFFGAPVLGDLSDKYGRKRLLELSIYGTLIGYIITAIGIVMGSLELVFVGRLVDGFTGGNISVAQSSIADLSTKETKTRNFGLIGMAFGIGFVIGPYLGGKLSDPGIISWFDFATPFWFAAILSALNLLMISFNLKESLKVKGEAKINLLGGVSNIMKGLKLESVRNMLFVVFLFNFGFNFFSQFFQVYLIDKFEFTQGQIGDLFAYIGLWIAITQRIILRPLLRRFKSKQILMYSLLFLSVAFLMLLVPQDAILILLVLPFVAIFNGLSQPNIISITSDLADEKTQGEILGINQSIRSLAQAIPAIIAGVITSISINAPILVASGVTFLAWLAFMVFVRDKKIEKFSD